MNAGIPSHEPDDPLKGFDLPLKLRAFRAESSHRNPIAEFSIVEQLVSNELVKLHSEDDPELAAKMFRRAGEHGLEISCDSKVTELRGEAALREKWCTMDKAAIPPDLKTWLDTLFRYYDYRAILVILDKECEPIFEEHYRRMRAIISWPARAVVHMWNYLVSSAQEVAAWSSSHPPAKVQETPAVRAPKKAVKGD